jgi:tagaturonate reductase
MQALRRSAPFALPIKILQFGQGNFLRGFFDWQVDLLNERTGLDAGVVIVRPRGGGSAPLLDVQDGLFTVLVRGLDEFGQAVKEYRQVSCVKQELDLSTSYAEFLAQAANPELRFIVSNTTEAGIATNESDRFDDAPASSFPAKLARLLFERFTVFGPALDKGVILLPCELIDHNGPALKSAVLHFARLWKLDPAFEAWIHEACIFCSTLVDRIVTGYPAGDAEAIGQELGCSDQFLVAAEYYYLFVIQGPASLAQELRLDGANLNVKLVADITPYKKRKVGILNGGHTALVPVALLAGLEAVAESVDDPQVGAWLVEAIDKEIIPALQMDRAELDAFAGDVLRRFRNPAIHHRLASIALNSWPKFAARVMPQLLNYIEINHGKLPWRLVLALAATMVLYRGGVIELSDDKANLDWFAQGWQKVADKKWNLDQLAQGWLANTALWGRDLNQVHGLHAAVTQALERIENEGIRQALS